MVALELLDVSGQAATREVDEAIAHCREAGLLLINAGPEGNVIRLMPPLVVTKDQIDEAVEILNSALQTCF